MKPTTSERRIQANRANAAKSTGPKTAEGRAISSQNGYRHGLCTTTFIVCNEKLEEYTALRRDFAARFGPRDHVEACLVDRMVHATWNLMRSWTAENEALNLQMFRMDGALQSEYDNLQEHTRLTAAVEEKSKQPSFRTLARYQAHQSMEYQRAYRMLLDIRKNFPIAPSGPLRPVVFEPFASPHKTRSRPTSPPPNPNPHNILRKRTQCPNPPHSQLRNQPPAHPNEGDPHRPAHRKGALLTGQFTRSEPFATGTDN